MAEPVRARRLTDQEGQRLLQIVRRGKHESVRVRRAMIIMASASGTLVPAIARLVAADEDTVRDVIRAFNAQGLAALDPSVGGRPSPPDQLGSCGGPFTDVACHCAYGLGLAVPAAIKAYERRKAG
jgi:hypothetical protein